MVGVAELESATPCVSYKVQPAILLDLRATLDVMGTNLKLQISQEKPQNRNKIYSNPLSVF